MCGLIFQKFAVHFMNLQIIPKIFFENTIGPDDISQNFKTYIGYGIAENYSKMHYYILYC